MDNDVAAHRVKGAQHTRRTSLTAASNLSPPLEGECAKHSSTPAPRSIQSVPLGERALTHGDTDEDVVMEDGHTTSEAPAGVSGLLPPPAISGGEVSRRVLSGSPGHVPPPHPQGEGEAQRLAGGGSPNLGPIDTAPVSRPAQQQPAVGQTSVVLKDAVSGGERSASFVLHIHDGSIDCVCTPGTTRQAKDLVMISTQSGIGWIHVPCIVYAAKAEGSKNTTKGKQNAPKPGSDEWVASLESLTGPNPSAAKIQKAKNFATKFICDGTSCEGSEYPLNDYELCKKCLTWQHKECILYGKDERDCSGPVCNECYMEAYNNRDAILKWQRRRLLEAIQEAMMYLTDPDTAHEVWRREWCQKFVTRFMNAVRIPFLQSLVNTC
jgi:hypothetical protein